MDSLFDDLADLAGDLLLATLLFWVIAGFAIALSVTLWALGSLIWWLLSLFFRGAWAGLTWLYACAAKKHNARSLHRPLPR